MISLYLIRHGECEGKGLYIGRHSDPPLTDEGILQIRKAARLLMEECAKPDRIISSPLKRTKESTLLINERFQVIPEYLPVLEESDFGDWEGCSYSDILLKNPDELDKWISNPVEVRPPGGESLLDLQSRLNPFIEKLNDHINSEDKFNYFLLSHRGPIGVLLLNFLNMNLEKFWAFRLERGSVTKLNLYSGYCEVEYLNRKG